MMILHNNSIPSPKQQFVLLRLVLHMRKAHYSLQTPKIWRFLSDWLSHTLCHLLLSQHRTCYDPKRTGTRVLRVPMSLYASRPKYFSSTLIAEL